MRRGEKITLIVGSILIALGGIITLIAFMLNDFSLRNIYGLEERVIEQELDNSLDNIIFDIAEADATINLSEDNKNKLVIKDTNKLYHSIEASDGALKIKRINSFGIMSFLAPIHSFDMNISLYLNKESLHSLEIKGVAGDISLNNLMVKNLKIQTIAGNVRLNNIKAQDLSINTVSGGLAADGLSADSFYFKTISGLANINDAYNTKAKISTVSGDIFMDSYECDSLELDSISGNTKIIFLSPKNISYRTISGRYIIPNSVEGEAIVKIKSTSGDILLYIKENSSI